MPKAKPKIAFKFGAIVQTRGVCVKRNEDIEFNFFVQKCLSRHLQGDWGDIDEHDRKENELSLKEGFRLMSVYKQTVTQVGITPQETVLISKIWIITEADRSATTILFPEEY